jgi:hypothetical protein
MKNINDIINKNNENADVNDPFSGFASREDFLKERQERDTNVKVIEEQKTFIWTRIYLNEEDDSLKPGDKIFIEYTPTGEVLETTFAAYNKKSVFKDKEGEVVQEYDPEDDLKTLCVAVDIDWINNPQNDIPFIRTLFKQGRFYEYQLLKFSELKVYKGEKEFEYHSIDF